MRSVHRPLLASQLFVQNLGFVVEYSNYYFRGNLDGEGDEVTLSVIYEDSKQGKKKSFDFKGSVEGLEKSIKKFDVNKFMDDN